MGYQVVRLGTDFSSSPQNIVKNYLSANWNLSSELAAAKLLFSCGWWQKQPQYIVNVRHDIDKLPKWRTVGNKPISQFDDVLQVHCWATEQTDDTEPINLDAMCREVQRIINQDVAGLQSSGIYQMSCGSAKVMPLEDSQAAIFHSVQRVQVWYLKRNI